MGLLSISASLCLMQTHRGEGQCRAGKADDDIFDPQPDVWESQALGIAVQVRGSQSNASVAPKCRVSDWFSAWVEACLGSGPLAQNCVDSQSARPLQRFTCTNASMCGSCTTLVNATSTVQVGFVTVCMAAVAVLLALAQPLIQTTIQAFPDAENGQSGYAALEMDMTRGIID